jgi:hypothetical protein
MAQYIKNADIFGRVGSGIGQGLAEQVPKEIENYRLRTGLKNLANEADRGELSPAQFLARAAGTYGATPQIVQSFGDLARQQGMAKALEKSQQAEKNPYSKDFFQGRPPSASAAPASQVPSITSGENLSDVLKGNLSPTTEERYAIGAKVFEDNPARWGNDPRNALAAVDKEVEIQKERYQQKKELSETQSAIQKNVSNSLKAHSGDLGVQIPSNIYSSIENEAIQAVKPKNEGGRGLSEEQAVKEFGDKMDEVSRDYKDIDAMGGWSLMGRKASESIRALKSLKDRFKGRNDTENFADSLVGKLSISPIMGYAIADPVADHPDINKYLKTIPNLEDLNKRIGPVYGTNVRRTPELVYSELMNAMGQEGSPLAIAYELEKKGYDPQAWLSYLDKNKEEWNPTIKQLRQITKPDAAVRSLNDWWLGSFTGLE